MCPKFDPKWLSLMLSELAGNQKPIAHFSISGVHTECRGGKVQEWVRELEPVLQ